MSYEAVGSKAGAFSAATALRLPLAEQLALYGIKTIPQRIVSAHKAHAVRGRSPLFTAFVVALGYVSFVNFYLAWERRGTRMRSDSALFLGDIALVVAGFAIALAGSSAGLFLCVPFIALFKFSLVMGDPDAFKRCVRWERARIAPNGENASRTNLPWLPERLQDRARAATLIPGARLYMDFIEEDPILVVVRGFGPWREEAAIGAWATGNDFLDAF
jgi:hypothetical protein